MAKEATSKYQVERQFFAAFKRAVEAEERQIALREYEQAIANVISEYNTAIYENRFVVGGVVEVLLLALIRSAGIGAMPCGSEETGGDILLPSGELISVKANFTGTGSLRLINKQGGGNRPWTVPTLFVLAGLGILYGDPSMAQSGDLEDTNDAIQIKRKALVRWGDDLKNLIQLDIPRKPKASTAGESKKASDAIARDILRQLNLQTLLSQLEDPS